MLKNNVILIVLCIGITLIHNASGGKVKKNIELYYDPQSPQGRAVLLTLEALNLEFNLKSIRYLAKDKLKEIQIPIYCLHTIPSIIDGDFVLSEGHAIIPYLVRKYGEKDDHPLYPNNLKIKAKINQILHFDDGTLYPAFKDQYLPWIFHRIPKTKEGDDKIHERLNFLENVLKKSPWIAGESMTVADFTLVASITTFKVAGVDLEKYDKINEWLEKCKNTMVGYEVANQAGINELQVTIKTMDEQFANSPPVYE